MDQHGHRSPNPAALLSAAHWVTTPEPTPPYGQRPAYEFRTTFELDALPEAAWLTSTAHGIYEAFVNGERAGDDELAPGATSYRRTLLVQRFDVATRLKQGLNELRIVVSDGWFRGKCGPDRVSDNFGTEVAVIAHLAVTRGSSFREIVTDPSWHVAVGAIVAADLMDGQYSDLRRIGHESWEPAVLARDPLTRDASRLAWPTAPPVRATAAIAPVSVHRIGGGRQVVDFGRNLNGRVRLSQLGEAGRRIELTHGEVLDDQGDLSLANLAYAPPWKPPVDVGQKDTVVSRGVDGDVFEPRHTTHGFRYVAVDGIDEDLDPRAIAAVEVRTDLTPLGSFACSDASISRLHEITVASWRANSCDIPTDCPQRERWGYTGDFQVFARSAAFLDDIEEFARKWLRSLADDQSESGLITNVAPLCGVSYDPAIPVSLDGAAGWGDAATIVPWELYRQYGDIGILAEFFPMMSAWVDYAAGIAASGRRPERVEAHPEPLPHEKYLWDTGWQWGEWLEPGVEFDWQKDQGIVATAYLAHSAGIVARAAAVLSREDVAAAYAELERNVIAAWQREYISHDGSLTEPTQANLARALAFDLMPPALRPRAAKTLASIIERNGDRLSTGFLATGLLLPALADHGYSDLAYRLLLQRREPSWMTMLDRGATTVWEAWDGVDQKGVARGSLNHYSKGAVVAFLHEYIAGIRPAAPGYASVDIRPVPHHSLDQVKASLQTRHGRVSVSWTLRDSRFVLECRTPHGVPTLVRLPDGTEHSHDGGAQTLACWFGSEVAST